MIIFYKKNLKSVSVSDSFYFTILLELVVPTSNPNSLFSFHMNYQQLLKWIVSPSSLIKFLHLTLRAHYLPGFSHGHSMSASFVRFLPLASKHLTIHQFLSLILKFFYSSRNHRDLQQRQEILSIDIQILSCPVELLVSFLLRCSRGQFCLHFHILFNIPYL